MARVAGAWGIVLENDFGTLFFLPGRFWWRRLLKRREWTGVDRCRKRSVWMAFGEVMGLYVRLAVDQVFFFSFSLSFSFCSLLSSISYIRFSLDENRKEGANVGEKDPRRISFRFFLSSCCTAPLIHVGGMFAETRYCCFLFSRYQGRRLSERFCLHFLPPFRFLALNLLVVVVFDKNAPRYVRLSRTNKKDERTFRQGKRRKGW